MSPEVTVLADLYRQILVQRGHQACSGRRERERFLFPNLPGARILRNLEACLGFKNNYILNGGFKIESLQTIMKVIQEYDRLISVDLLDAYLHAPMRKQHQGFLKFAVWDHHYQFTYLPFGICAASRVFLKILFFIISLICLDGVKIYNYLDNIIILHWTTQGTTGRGSSDSIQF